MKVSSRLVAQQVWTVRANGKSQRGGVPRSLRPALVGGRGLVLEFLADGVLLERTTAWRRASEHVADEVARHLRRLVSKRDRLVLLLEGGDETTTPVEGRRSMLSGAHRALLDQALGQPEGHFVFRTCRTRDEVRAQLLFEPPAEHLAAIIRSGWNRAFRAYVVPHAHFQARSRAADPMLALARAVDMDGLERVRRELETASIVCEAWSDESALRLWSVTFSHAALARRLKLREAREPSHRSTRKSAES